tara:strand:- start:332 stop:685 length:354 start_codon:yes stop_codon:yes gene_type:complete
MTKKYEFNEKPVYTFRISNSLLVSLRNLKKTSQNMYPIGWVINDAIKNFLELENNNLKNDFLLHDFEKKPLCTFRILKDHLTKLKQIKHDSDSRLRIGYMINVAISTWLDKNEKLLQ